MLKAEWGVWGEVTVWRRIWFGAVLTALAVPNVAAADQDVLTMPLQCTVQSGRVMLTPVAADRTYRILGAHENHGFTACAPAAPDVCRTWTVHKFDIACDGGRVPWINVVAAFLEATPRRAWVEGGRVHFRMGPRWNGPAYDGACDPQRNAGAPSPECKRSAQADGGAVIALPAGFAPMLSTGGRFVPVTAPVPALAAADPPKEQRPPVQAPSSAPKAAAELPTKPRDPPAHRPPSIVAAAPPSANSGGWETITAPSYGTDALDAEAAQRKRSFVLVMIAMMLATMSFVIAHRWWSDQLVPSRSRKASRGTEVSASKPVAGAAASTDSDNTEADVVSALIAGAVTTHQAVRQVVASLKALTLKDVLTADLDDVRKSLLSPELTAHVTEHRWREARAMVEGIAGDLERVRRIAASAAALEVEARSTVTMPETTADAFEILGINADARPVVIKKIVDALRQSWHPDLARSEDDRRARESRIKQINVAWDLISARQKAA